MEFRETWAGEPRLVTADEIEMLTLYLYQIDLSGRLSQAPENSLIFHPVNQAAFDAWYDGQAGIGPIAERPHIKTTTRMRRFIDQKQQMKPNGWLASVTAARQVPLTVATVLDLMEPDLVRSVRKEDLIIRGDKEYTLIVVADGIPWSIIFDILDLQQIVAEKPVTLLLRQRRNRLHLEDVRLPR